MSAEMMPPNATEEEEAMAAAIDALISAIPLTIKDMWSVDDCPPKLLPWLAAAVSVDFWDPEWPESRKRAVIRGSIDWHRRKGTPAAIREVLEAMGFGSVVIREFRHQPRYGTGLRYGDGSRYEQWEHWADYRVEFPDAIEPKDAARIASILRTIAPARCRLTRVNLSALKLVYGAGATYGGGFRYGGPLSGDAELIGGPT